jgi:hypothetical protein
MDTIHKKKLINQSFMRMVEILSAVFSEERVGKPTIWVVADPFFGLSRRGNFLHTIPRVLLIRSLLPSHTLLHPDSTRRHAPLALAAWAYPAPTGP